jgi:hypothetical protein
MLLMTAFAQPSQTQISTDTENNAEIVFTYSNPAANTPTMLHFSVSKHVSTLIPVRLAFINADRKTSSTILGKSNCKMQRHFPRYFCFTPALDDKDRPLLSTLHGFTWCLDPLNTNIYMTRMLIII